MTAAVPRPSNRTLRRLTCSAVTAAAVVVAFQAGRRIRPSPSPAPEPPAVVKDEPPAGPGSRRRPWRRVLLAVSVLVVTGGTVGVVADELDGYACLSSPVIAPDTAPTGVPGMQRVPRIESLAYRGPRFAVGDTVRIRDSAVSEMVREVEVRGVDDVEPDANLQPAAGRRLVSVSVREHNISRLGLYLLTYDKVWLCDADGTWYEHDARLTKQLKAGDALGFDAGMRFDHRVVFQIYEHSRPTRVRVAGSSGDPASGDWKVG
ncbi:hypothetical protein [Actinoplanes philippinensis]|uniref:hypothetical protein n=1 Tax=Actinoplanes philippinensis TaxID=35752 RepID=UPI0033C62986